MTSDRERYSYSPSSKSARNANGELPDSGRWKNCRELADDFVKELSTTLSTYNKRGYCKRCNKWLQLHGEADNI